MTARCASHAAGFFYLFVFVLRLRARHDAGEIGILSVALLGAVLLPLSLVGSTLILFLGALSKRLLSVPLVDGGSLVLRHDLQYIRSWAATPEKWL